MKLFHRQPKPPESVDSAQPSQASLIRGIFRVPVLANLLIALAGFAILARLARFSLDQMNSHQVFALGFGLGMITAGSAWPHLGRRTAVGFLLGAAGCAAFAAALFWL